MSKKEAIKELRKVLHILTTSRSLKEATKFIENEPSLQQYLPRCKECQSILIGNVDDKYNICWQCPKCLLSVEIKK